MIVYGIWKVFCSPCLTKQQIFNEPGWNIYCNAKIMNRLQCLKILLSKGSQQWERKSVTSNWSPQLRENMLKIDHKQGLCQVVDLEKVGNLRAVPISWEQVGCSPTWTVNLLSAQGGGMKEEESSSWKRQWEQNFYSAFSSRHGDAQCRFCCKWFKDTDLFKATDV